MFFEIFYIYDINTIMNKYFLNNNIKEARTKKKNKFKKK